ncbi:MAG TPA: DUF1501 domain-containing protein [Tepidisphaeraceae bacterium]|nr:DUF1501 domain-containing protein [Tepidisphaeraceae bacterium]
MNPTDPLHLTRRALFGRTATGIGSAALASLLNPSLFAQDVPAAPALGALKVLYHAPRAKRVIYLFMSGGPSHIDLFDHKPALANVHGAELPNSVRNGQRITGMTSGQKSFPCVAPMFKFARHGQAGTWFSELLPHIASVADDLCVVKSLHTEAINHDPAVTFVQTGAQQPGRPSIGSWLSYGLGSENSNLPAFVVMVSQGSGNKNDQPLTTRHWASGFIPTQHQGVRFRSGNSDPVLYLSNPPGVDPAARRDMLDSVQELNRLNRGVLGDPEIDTRIAQYEMAFRMQSAVPELTDLRSESKATLAMYGLDENGNAENAFARNCLLARRMAERGVRFVQLFHRGWDQHSALPKQLRMQCKDVDQASAALIKDLKSRGMLDDTLVVWGGEFGRTVYSQGALTKDNYGRDHHGRCYSAFATGGGIKGGLSYGATDDYCYNVTENPVHVHDWNATLLHCLGLNHERLTYKFQGRDYRLTDVHGNVVKALMA